MSKFRQRKTDDTVRSTRYYSDKQETKVATAIGGKKVSNSGATPYFKGDVSNDLFTIECKTKVKDSKTITIQKEWLEKLKSESLFMKTKYEALVFNFGPDSDDYAIIDMNLFKQLISYLENDEEE